MAVRHRHRTPGQGKAEHREGAGTGNTAGVLNVFYQHGWTIGPKAGPKAKTSLITNAEGVPKAVHKSLVKADIEKSERYEPQRAEAILEHIAKGCQNELCRRKELAQIQREGVETRGVLEEDPKWLMKRQRHRPKRRESICPVGEAGGTTR